MFQILTVCTGNICRSPAAQILLARALDESVQVTSAGTFGMPAWPVSPPMARLLSAHPSAQSPNETTISSFCSSALTPEKIRQADLILAMDNGHKQEILEMAPTALRKTFTLGEFARHATALAPLLSESGQQLNNDAEKLHALTSAAAARRRLIRNNQPSDDVQDPYGKGDAAYAHSFVQMTNHIEPIIAYLTSAPTREVA